MDDRSACQYGVVDADIAETNVKCVTRRVKTRGVQLRDARVVVDWRLFET